MKIALSTSALIIAASLALTGCRKEAPRPSAPAAPSTPVAEAPVEAPAKKFPAGVSEIALSDVPEDVTEMVTTAYPNFTIKEVLKKDRDGKTYFDVEGELTGGSEIEFDVLMTDAGPEIVEIQRDIRWVFTPQSARDLVDEANTENLEIVRVIESVQTADNSIIYEIFVADHPTAPSFEVQIKDEVTTLLAERAEH